MICHRRRKFQGLYPAVLGYVSMSEEANVKLVELVGEHPILYDWTDPRYSKRTFHRVWENIRKGLNKRGNMLQQISKRNVGLLSRERE
jgi:hypothetical protein